MSNIISERPEFSYPTGQLSVDIKSRGRRVPNITSLSAPRSTYLTTCYDEFSRDFITISIAKDSPEYVETVSYPIDHEADSFPEIDGGSTNTNTDQTAVNVGKDVIRMQAVKKLPILQHFVPQGCVWPSTIRYVPPDATHLLERQPSTDINVFMRFDSWHAKDSVGAKEPFEPLFAAFSYFLVNERYSMRISESFRVDLTPEHIKRKYHESYFAFLSKDSASDRGVLEEDPVTTLSMSMFPIPENVPKSEIFFVAQVFKILSGDAESAVAPYMKPSYSTGSSISSEMKEKHEEVCRRLKYYRQQVGVAFVPLFDDQGRIGQRGGSQVRMQVYATKKSVNDATIGQHIRELYPTDGTSRIKLESTQIEIVCTLFNLGVDRQVTEHLPLVLRDATPNFVPSQFCSSSEAAAVESWEGDSILSATMLANSIRKLAFLPITPTLLTETNTTGDVASSTRTGGASGATLSSVSTSAANSNAVTVIGTAGVDEFGTPVTASIIVEEALNQRRHLKTGVDHSIFIYPTLAKQFSKRNLCLHVKLIEFSSTVRSRFPSPKAEHTVLCHMYNTMPGPIFTEALKTSVWYHNNSPTLADELKVRLPDFLTARHWLMFEVRHVHVKPKTSAGGGIGGWFVARETVDIKAEIVGVGFLQLLPLGLTLISDQQHAVIIRRTNEEPTENDFIGESTSDKIALKKRLDKADEEHYPVVYVVTRSLSSFKSTCPHVQRALSWGPIPLGTLPSTIMTSRQHDLTVPFGPSETRAAMAIKGLDSPKVTNEVTNHFLVLLRHVIRGLCGGNGLYDEKYTSPFEHCTVRCNAFITMLQLFGRLVPDVTFSRDGHGRLMDMDLLLAYVDYMFDEEVAQGSGRNSTRYTAAAAAHAFQMLLNQVDSAGDQASTAPQKRLELEIDEAEASSDTDMIPRRTDFDESEIVVDIPRNLSHEDDSDYLSYCAEHLMFQLERIALEDAILDAVCGIITMDFELAEDAKKQSDSVFGTCSVTSGLRWWTGGMYQRDEFPVGLLPTQQSQLFEPELKWFQSVDAELSYLENYHEVGVLDNYFVVTHELLASSAKEERIEELQISNTIEISKLHPRYSSLAGYSVRKEQIIQSAAAAASVVAEVGLASPQRGLQSYNSTIALRLSPTSSLKSGSTSPNYGSGSDGGLHRNQSMYNGRDEDCKVSISLSGTPSDIQWWPWVYEVLTYQWLSMLCMFHGSPTVSLPEVSFPLGMAYPFNTSNIPRNASAPCFDTRSLALDHGPVLLKMILKSLALRIHRERKSGLVILDEEYFRVLERLLEEVCEEATLPTTSLFGARNLISAVSQFIAHLFGMIVPGQVATIVSSIFALLKTKTRIGQVKLRLQMVSDLTYLDSFVSLNLPTPLDASYTLFRDLNGVGGSDIPIINHFASRVNLCLDGAAVDPHPHWLAELVIDECVGSYRNAEKSAKDSALSILCDLFVRLSYDARYQSKASRQRIAVMFLPLLGEVLRETNNLRIKAHDADERRGLLTLALAILQDLPINLLREIIRKFCDNSVSKANGGGVELQDSNGLAHKTLWELLNLLHLFLDSFEVSGLKESLPEPQNSARNGVQGATASAAFGASVRTTISKRTLTGRSGVEALEQAQLDRYGKRGSQGIDRVTKSVGNPAEDDKTSRFQHRPSLGNKHQDPARLFEAGNNRVISTSCTSVVARVVTVVLEESPHFVLYSISLSSLRKINLSLLQMLPPGENELDDMFRVLESAMAVILHGLHCFQSESSLISLFHVANVAIHRFGARLFLTVLGDSLQDWARCALKISAMKSLSSSTAACGFIATLFRSVFFYFGSLTTVSDVFLAVLDDVIDSLLQDISDKKRTFDEEDAIIQPLEGSIGRIKANFLQKMEKLTVADDRAMFSFYSASITIFSSIEYLLLVDAYRRRHISHPVGYDWLGTNTLDGPFDPTAGSGSVWDNIQRLRANHRLVSESDRPKRLKLEAEEVMSMFFKASLIFDPIRLPRQRIRWLECLARLLDVKSNRAESAEVRWRIFLLCKDVSTTWSTRWAPRQPLAWVRGGRSGSNGQQSKNFLSVLYSSCATIGRHWQNKEQHRLHMETCLAVTIDRFTAVGLVYLAERSTSQMLVLHRSHQARLDKMMLEYTKLSNLFKTVSDSGSSAFAMGTYYWVQYLGKGVPKHLRQEFIYRNPSNLHVSEFHSLIVKVTESLVTEGVSVRISSMSTPTEADYASNDVVIFITSVKPLKNIRRDGIPVPYAANQAKQFQHFVPFTMNPKKAHAKTMDQQWKRSLVFTVEDYFPYVAIRQPVLSKSTADISPIEVAIDDINDRVSAMAEELENARAADTNNLMRLIQGTVMPQVNAGAAEVARVFLPLVNSDVDNRSPEAAESSPALVAKLKETLVEFMGYSKKLLAKSRRLLLSEPASSNTTSTSDEENIAVVRKDSKVDLLPAGSSVANTNFIWQSEMERGYDNLLESILPRIADLPAVAHLPRSYVATS